MSNIEALNTLKVQNRGTWWQKSATLRRKQWPLKCAVCKNIHHCVAMRIIHFAKAVLRERNEMFKVAVTNATARNRHFFFLTIKDSRGKVKQQVAIYQFCGRVLMGLSYNNLLLRQNKGRFTHSMPFPYHAVPLRV